MAERRPGEASASGRGPGRAGRAVGGRTAGAGASGSVWGHWSRHRHSRGRLRGIYTHRNRWSFPRTSASVLRCGCIICGSFGVGRLLYKVQKSAPL